MKPETPGEGHARIHADGTDLLIDIPSRPNAFATGFVGFWLCGWAVGELAVLRIILSGSGHVFLLAWLGAWTIGGILAGATFLWDVAGRERVWVTDDGIRIDRSIPVWRRSRLYDGSSIRRLRTTTAKGSFGFGTKHGGVLASFATGAISFDYGRETVRFGLDLDEADAYHVVQTIGERFG